MVDTDNTKTHTDIKSAGWQVTIFPPALRSYAILVRLDRPIGWWLLLLPGWWSIALASGGVFGMGALEWGLMLAFYIGAIVMRSAGCVINDLWDRKLDAQVERTRARPLASGVINPKQALVFLAMLCVIGAGILFSLTPAAILLGFCSLPLIVLYPFMKRITYWPQLFLGFTFNFGALMGWAAVTGEISFAPIALYIGGILWTLGYDTIYAHQDKEDDIMAGVKSTALRLGSASKGWVAGFYLVALTLMAVAILTVKFSPLALVLMLLPIAHMTWQLQRWDMNDPQSSLRIFKSNRDFGLLLLIVCLL